MLPFENKVADYVERTENHVLYRATPIFEGNNLLATGVLLEGFSREDHGAGVCFNVFCYNSQPGIQINYANGESNPVQSAASNSNSTPETATPSTTYIGNKNSKKFHYPNCGSVSKMNEKNKVFLNCTRYEAIAQGYSPCGNCKP